MHRLDKDTSGCLILIKNKNYIYQLNKKNNTITKEYHALVVGNTQNNFNIILQQSILNKYNKKIKNDEKNTISYCKKIKSYKSYSFIKILPVTGKIHQIRIHLSHIGHPVLNDKKYGNLNFNNNMKKIGISRLLLHSASIKFICPIQHEEINIKAPYDNIINNILNKL